MSTDTAREPGEIDFSRPSFEYLKLMRQHGMNSPEAEAFYSQHKDDLDFRWEAGEHRRNLLVLSVTKGEVPW